MCAGLSLQVSMSAAFRIPRETLTETEPASEEAGVSIINFIQSKLDKTVPKHRIEAINKIIMDIMTSKTSAEEDDTGVSFGYFFHTFLA